MQISIQSQTVHVGYLSSELETGRKSDKNYTRSAEGNWVNVIRFPLRSGRTQMNTLRHARSSEIERLANGQR